MLKELIIQADAEAEAFEIIRGYPKYTWLSALVDGEGCLFIAFNKQRTSENPAVKIGISISNTNREILEVAKIIAGGGSICRKALKENRKPSWVLTIPTGITRILLPKLHLIAKREQKKILLKALSLIGITPMGGRKRIRRSLLIEITLKSLKKQLHELNFRGIK